MHQQTDDTLTEYSLGKNKKRGKSRKKNQRRQTQKLTIETNPTTQKKFKQICEW
jgi:hypothetical protein